MTKSSVFRMTWVIMIGVLAGCSTSLEEKPSHQSVQVAQEAEIAARQGESVSRVCPGRNDGWKAFGDDAVLVEAEGEWYRIELAGTCDPDSAFVGIAGSSCVSRGETMITARPRYRERCWIKAIYKWDVSEQEAASPGVSAKP